MNFNLLALARASERANKWEKTSLTLFSMYFMDFIFDKWQIECEGNAKILSIQIFYDDSSVPIAVIFARLMIWPYVVLSSFLLSQTSISYLFASLLVVIFSFKMCFFESLCENSPLLCRFQYT